MNRENKEVRADILRVLKASYPVPISDRILAEALSGVNYSIMPTELTAHLVYLRDKGYVKMQEYKDDEFNLSRDVYVLSAKGVDLLEGNIPPDPGIGD